MNFYSAAHDFGVVWNDPEINIDWPKKDLEIILSDKDQKLPSLCDVENLFP